MIATISLINAMIQPHELPDDVINIIIKFYYDFQVAEAADRIQIFKTSYGDIWTSVLTQLPGTSIPYNFHITTYDDTQLSATIFIDDYDFRGINHVAAFNAWTIDPVRHISNSIQNQQAHQ